MDFSINLNGKVAVVTGSTSGIGIGVAKVMALNGAEVVVTGRREEKGQAVVDEITALGGKAYFHKLDITSEESIKTLMDDVHEKFGHLDVLVNNAASVAAKDGNITDITAEDWDHMLDSDLKSVFLASKYAIGYMLENHNGSIINIGSSSGVAGNLGWSAYGPAKAAVANLTKNIAYQYGKQGIRCNCIHPGLIVTPQNKDNIPDFFRDIYLDCIEVDRVGCPEDIGYLATFLASDMAGFITSVEILADGGMMSHGPTYDFLRKLG